MISKYVYTYISVSVWVYLAEHVSGVGAENGAQRARKSDGRERDLKKIRWSGRLNQTAKFCRRRLMAAIATDVSIIPMFKVHDRL